MECSADAKRSGIRIDQFDTASKLSQPGQNLINANCAQAVNTST